MYSLEGGALEEFSIMIGVRQGNLISTYLFAICFKWHLSVVFIVVDHKVWNQISSCTGALKISHLTYW